MGKIAKNPIFQTLKSNFTMNGASGKVIIWNFFFWNGLYFHHTKNQPGLRPRSTFSEHWPWFWPYLFSEKVMKLFWYKIWVIFWSKNHFLQFRGVFWLRNKHLLLSTFCSFQNPMGHLNLKCNAYLIFVIFVTQTRFFG